MGLGEELLRESEILLRRAERFFDAVVSEAYSLLERELSERLPDLVPIDTGLLSRSFTFEVRPGEDGSDSLFVENSAFYSDAIARFGDSHDVERIVLEEADTIINGAGFESTVFALARLKAGL